MRKFALLVGIGFLSLCAIAQAQPALAPIVPTVNQNDLVPDIVNGYPTAGTQFATIPQIAGAPGYVYGGTIVTSATFTFPHAVTDYFAHAAGTLALVTPTTEANPSDGQRECYWLDQTTTALTWTANTGQTIGANVITAGTAKTPNCITYDKAQATWYSSP